MFRRASSRARSPSPGCRDSPAVALEHAHGRAFGLAERLAHDASGEQADVGIVTLGEGERRALASRREGADPRQPAWADAANERRETAANDKVGEPRRKRETPLLRDGVETDAPDRTTDAALGVALGEHLARAFHDPAERNARGARGLARAAHQAGIEVSGQRRARRRGRSDELTDELDAPAG
jgi:hypothetical protein